MTSNILHTLSEKQIRHHILSLLCLIFFLAFSSPIFANDDEQKKRQQLKNLTSEMQEVKKLLSSLLEATCRVSHERLSLDALLEYPYRSADATDP